MHNLFEFYCSGGCGGYIRVPLQTDDERDIIVVCPSCRHEHYRGLKDGEITERRHGHTMDSESVHRIEPTLAAYSRTPQLQRLLQERGFLGELWSRFGRAN